MRRNRGGKYHRPRNLRETLRRAGVQLAAAHEGESVETTAAAVKEHTAELHIIDLKMFTLFSEMVPIDSK